MPAFRLVSGDAECPRCGEVFSVVEVMRNEIVRCTGIGCGIDLEVINDDPIELDIAPGDDEDVGE